MEPKIYTKIKKICAERKISVASIERELDLPNGMISKWDLAVPLATNLRMVAEYLGVSMEYLMEE